MSYNRALLYRNYCSSNYCMEGAFLFTIQEDCRRAVPSGVAKTLELSPEFRSGGFSGTVDASVQTCLMIPPCAGTGRVLALPLSGLGLRTLLSGRRSVPNGANLLAVLRLEWRRRIACSWKPPGRDGMRSNVDERCIYSTMHSLTTRYCDLYHKHHRAVTVECNVSILPTV